MERNEIMKLPRMFAVLLVAALVAAPLALAQDGEKKDAAPAEMKENPFQKVIRERADSIVEVRFVMSLDITLRNGQKMSQEQNGEVRGVVVDAKGLVMTSNDHLEVHMRNPQATVEGTPGNFRIVFGNEETEHEARLVARDSDLGLAFLQPLDLKDVAVKPVALEGEPSVVVGQELIGVSRLPRGFDRAPLAARLYLTSHVERPREMWSVAGEFSGIGLPVFSTDGKVAGVLTGQRGSEGVEGEGRSQPALPFLLPVATVARVVKQAEDKAAEALTPPGDK